jgi:N-acyl-D-amino-acid deacylase
LNTGTAWFEINEADELSGFVIQNALVIDGSAGLPFEADIAIEEGIIKEIGPALPQKGRTVIDAKSHVVSPGFIDMHSHADFSLPVLPTADSLVHQGITTAVIGQCGLSPAPLLDPNRDQFIAGLSGILGGLDVDIPWQNWSSFGDYLAFLDDLGISLNIVPLVGQGTVRTGVMGFASGSPSQEQLERMKAEAIKALHEGAWGISTGLIYPPGSYASTEELVELTKAVAEQGACYFTHMRGEAETLLEAVAEAIQIGRRSGASVQISHFKAAGRRNWAKSAEALRIIDQALAEGLDVSADVYPYTAGSTGLVSLLPQWAQEGGKDSILKRLDDPALREKMKVDMETGGFAKSVDWGTVLITGSPKKRSYQGRIVSELAGEYDRTPQDWIFDALLETELQMNMAVFGMSENNRREELKHPAMTFGTDGLGLAVGGPLAKGLPHPRSYGAFARILGRYVREQGVLSLEEAVYKMTGLAAQKLRLKDRGLIRPGLAADLVIFDPVNIIDKATYENPHQYAEGILEVIVNGEMVLYDRAHTGARPGQVLVKG